jgi:hypothetical protein
MGLALGVFRLMAVGLNVIEQRAGLCPYHLAALLEPGQ